MKACTVCGKELESKNKTLRCRKHHLPPPEIYCVRPIRPPLSEDVSHLPEARRYEGAS